MKLETVNEMIGAPLYEDGAPITALFYTVILLNLYSHSDLMYEFCVIIKRYNADNTA